MRVPDIAQAFLVLLPFLLIGATIVAVVMWQAGGGKSSPWGRFGAWLGLVMLTVWVGSAIAFVAIHVLLFFVGTTAALAGLVGTTIFMLAMPFGWALVVRHGAASDHAAAHGAPVHGPERA